MPNIFILTHVPGVLLRISGRFVRLWALPSILPRWKVHRLRVLYLGMHAFGLHRCDKLRFSDGTPIPSRVSSSFAET